MTNQAEIMNDMASTDNTNKKTTAKFKTKFANIIYTSISPNINVTHVISYSQPRMLTTSPSHIEDFEWKRKKPKNNRRLSTTN